MAEIKPPQSGNEAQRIGAYRILGRLGAGGMGEVLQAYDDRLQRHVALKRIRHEAASDERYRRRLRREARLAAGLSHPAIVQVYDLLEDESGDHIVMEYVQGPTVAQRLDEGPLDLLDAVEWASQIASGLAEAHSRGLIHRDLKAENVVVTPSGSVKILDFGLAKPLHKPSGEVSLTEAGKLVGTARAMSPEQAGGAKADYRSDLFSFGVLLYEMVSGISPFRGDNALETLKKVQCATPPPLASLRPEAPQALCELAEALLRKNPRRRMRSALEASRRLELIKPQVSAMRVQESVAGGSSWPHALSGEPTSSSPSPRAGLKIRGAGGKVARMVRHAMLLAALPLILVLAYLLMTHLSAPPPLRVAVLQPAVTAAQEAMPGIDLVRSGLVYALVDSLISMQGITPLDPSQFRDVEGSSSQVARAMAADEVIRSEIECLGELCRISLNRIRASNGEVVWASNFDVLSNPIYSALSAEAVRTHLRQAFDSYKLQPDAADVEVRDADYASFLEINLRIQKGESPVEPLLAELEKIIRTSQRFPGAYLLASDLSFSIYTRTQDRGILEKGLHYANQAQELAPADSRPVVRRFRLLVEANQLAEARALLDEIERIAPGDALPLRSRLARREGRLREAVDWMEKAVQLRPTWQNLYRLADLEYRLGSIGPARTHLEELLVRVPGNKWGLSKLGEIELRYGDLDRAEQIYLELIQRYPSPASYTNLGLSRSLSGRYREAVQAYEKALEITPAYAAALLNLADAKQALGDPQAQQLYSSLLERFLKPESGSSPIASMRKAQCLVQLGRFREALKTTQQALADAPEDLEVLYLAAWVYACAGKRRSALLHAEKALRKGYQPRWFRLPGFHSLKDDPAFRSLLRKDFGSPPQS